MMDAMIEDEGVEMVTPPTPIEPSIAYRGKERN